MRVMNYYGANYVLASDVYGVLNASPLTDMKIIHAHQLWERCIGGNEYTLPSRVINYIQRGIGYPLQEEEWLNISFAIYLCLLFLQNGDDNDGKVTALFRKLNHTMYSRSNRMDGV